MTQATKSGLHYAWIVLAAACVLGIAARADSASFAVFVEPLVELFGWKRGDISFAYALAFLLGLPATIAMGWLGDRFGARPLMLVRLAPDLGRHRSPRHDHGAVAVLSLLRAVRGLDGARGVYRAAAGDPDALVQTPHGTRDRHLLGRAGRGSGAVRAALQLADRDARLAAGFHVHRRGSRHRALRLFIADTRQARRQGARRVR